MRQGQKENKLEQEKRIKKKRKVVTFGFLGLLLLRRGIAGCVVGG